MRPTRSLLLSIVLTAVAASAAGQDGNYRAPRTESGRPDLEGVWNFNTGVPLQRPVPFADRTVFTKAEFEQRRTGLRNVLQLASKFVPVEAVGLDWIDNTLYVEDLRTSLITYPGNGRLPALLAGAQRRPGVEDFLAALSNPKGGSPADLQSLLAAFGSGKKDSYIDFMLSERCLFGADVPLVPQIDSNYVQIIQGPDHVVLLTDLERRIIPLDGRPAPPDGPRTWSGTSRGRWDGEALVVETRNFNGRLPSFAGAGFSHEKAVTERFTRTSANTIAYAATVVDPKTFQDRIELSFPMARVDEAIYGFACHEGNYSLPLALSGARAEDEAKTTDSR